MISAKRLLIGCAAVLLTPSVSSAAASDVVTSHLECTFFQVKGSSALGVFTFAKPAVLAQQSGLVVLTVAVALVLVGAGLVLLWSVQLRKKVAARTAALRLSEGKLHALLDNTQQMQMLLDVDGRIVETNRSVLEFSGQSREDVIGKVLWGTNGWRDSAEAQEHLRSGVRSLMDGAPTAGFLTKQNDADAVARDLEYCLRGVKDDAGQLSFIVVEGRDVSAHKEAERQLRASEANLLALIENTHASIWSVDREYRYLTFNSHFRDAMSGRLGRAPEIGRSVEEIPPSEDAQHWKLLYDRAFAGEQFTVDFPVATISGMRQLQASFNPIQSGGVITGACVFSHDVTDYQRAAEALRQSEERTRLIIESSLDAVIGLNADGQILHWNTQAERIFGWSRDDVAGRALQETIFAHHFGEDGRVGLDDVLGRGAQADSQRRAETTAQRRDGKIFPVEVSTAAVQLGAGLARTAFVRDITDRRRLEWQLRQSQKMEAIGQLAGGVAHDFNNLLTVIQGNASLVQEGDLPAETAESALQEIVTATDRAAGLTRQLLTFSRQQVVQTDDLELNEVVGNMTRMLRRLIGEHITLQTQFASGSTLVHADAGMLEQIVLNLSVNARDAMPGGGNLTLRTSLVEVAEQSPELPPQARAGRFVRLDVSDTGTGIAAEDLPHIFEPFFTTKEVGRGTGLGLATVFGIVEQHHGWVDVDSTVGKGTCFSVYLPQPERAPKVERKEEAPAAVASGGSETILLVEDEDSVRVILSTMLRRQGYRVIEARNGEAALELWPGVRSEVDLLLTDMIMPQGVSGHDLAQRLAAEKPQLKIIYSSGYSSDVFRGDVVLPQGVAFLHKPYRAEVLLQTIRHSLDCVISS